MQRSSTARFAAPVAILIGLIALAALLLKFPPQQPVDDSDNRPQMAVATQRVERGDYKVLLDSYGRVAPSTQSLLVAQVGGQIVEVAESFDNGGFFKSGEVLLRIDPRDYQTNIKIAEAAVLDARHLLIEEKARARLARDDWRRSGKPGEPDALVLREPQNLAAQAKLASSEASLDKAKLDLDRTVIRAPYAGRVLARAVDVGQVLAPNERIGEIYATESVEIRLPVRNRDLKYVDLPEQYLDSAPTELSLPVATIFSELVAGQSWPARVVRTESAIDSDSRQLHVVAKIEKPFAQRPSQQRSLQPGLLQDDPAQPDVKRASAMRTDIDDADALPQIKIGQYVTAKINGKTLVDAIVIPLDAIYQGSFVYLVENGHIQRRDIRVAWQNQRDALIAQGLRGGEELVLTTLGQVVSGTPVRVIDDLPAPAQFNFEQLP